MIAKYSSDRFAGSESDDRKDEVQLIEAIAFWCECLQGKLALRQGLQMIAESLGSDAVALTRLGRDYGTMGRSIIIDRRARAGQEKLARSYATSVLGKYVSQPKPATIWYSSMVDGVGDPALSAFQRHRRFAELAVIPLTVEEKAVDFLELHFAERLDPDRVAKLNMALSTLCRTWTRRAPGLFTESILRSAKAEPEDYDGAVLLGMANPARLSRAEYRVCVLLSRGLSTKAIQSELAISASTLRTHLRNTYAKTGTQRQVELTVRLLTSRPVPRSATGAHLA